MSKRMFLASCALYLITGFLRAQNVPVTAVVDTGSVDVEHTAKLLYSKLNSAITQSGTHSESERGLYLVGELIPTGEDVVDTGMKKIIIRRYDLSLSIEQPMLDMQFGSLEIPLEGSGTTDAKVALDAIRKFNPESSSTQNLILESMKKADDYFINNVDNIIDKANMLGKSGDYDAGIALLWGCPNLPSIHAKVYNALEHLYLLKQNKDCANLFANANTAYSLKQYDEAISLLNQIDVESVCASEAKALAQKIGQEIRTAEEVERQREDKEQERQFQSEENQREREYKLERKRISAIESVATSYLNSHRSVFHYYSW